MERRCGVAGFYMPLIKYRAERRTPGLPVQILSGDPKPLPFANHLHRLVSGNHRAGRRRRPRTLHGPKAAVAAGGKSKEVPMHLLGISSCEITKPGIDLFPLKEVFQKRAAVVFRALGSRLRCKNANATSTVWPGPYCVFQSGQLLRIDQLGICQEFRLGKCGSRDEENTA
jgi:hypothetical protein